MNSNYEYMMLVLDSSDREHMEFHLRLWGEYGWEFCHVDPGNRLIIKRLKRYE